MPRISTPGYVCRSARAQASSGSPPKSVSRWMRMFMGDATVTSRFGIRDQLDYTLCCHRSQLAFADHWHCWPRPGHVRYAEGSWHEKGHRTTIFEKESMKVLITGSEGRIGLRPGRQCLSTRDTICADSMLWPSPIASVTITLATCVTSRQCVLPCRESMPLSIWAPYLVIGMTAPRLCRRTLWAPGTCCRWRMSCDVPRLVYFSSINAQGSVKGLRPPQQLADRRSLSSSPADALSAFQAPGGRDSVCFPNLMDR